MVPRQTVQMLADVGGLRGRAGQADGAVESLACGGVAAQLQVQRAAQGDAGLANANKLGALMYRALVGLPASISTTPKVVDRTLLEHLEGSRLTEDWYRVYGGEHAEGHDNRDQPLLHELCLLGGCAGTLVREHWRPADR